MLHLPRKMTHDWSTSHMKRYLQCAEQHVSSSNITEYCACHAKWLSKISHKFLENSWNVIYNAGPIRAWSDHDPRMIRPWNRQSATRLATAVTVRAHHEHFVSKNTTCRAPAIIPNFTKCCTCHEKWHLNFTKCCTCHAKSLSWLILITDETLFTMREVTWVNLRHHQMLHVPRKMTLMIDPHHIWNVIYNARSSTCHPPTSPNIYCACHAKWLSKISHKFLENSWNVIYNAGPEHDPTMIREWSEHETASPQPASQPRLLFELTTSIFYWKIQHFAPRLTFKNLPSAAPATKSNTWTSPSAAPATKSDTWTSPSAAPATKSNTWTSPSAAPAAKSDTWTTPSAAPATKSNTWTSPSAAPATKSGTWTSPSAAPATKSHTWTSPNAAPAMKSDTWTSPSAAPATKSGTGTSPSAAPATQNHSHDWSWSLMKRYLQCAE